MKIPELLKLVKMYETADDDTRKAILRIIRSNNQAIEAFCRITCLNEKIIRAWCDLERRARKGSRRQQKLIMVPPPPRIATNEEIVS